MNLDDIKAAIEAILFSLGESVELKKLAEITEMDIDTTRRILHEMMDEYYKPGRGIHLIELEGSYQLCTKKEHYEYIKKATHKTVKFELTEVQIETLSIIAYKQPITKLHIEQIRGVKSDHAVNRLVEYGIIEEKGRMQTPGRPILFGTTEAFLRNFGLTSTEDLPGIDDEKIKGFKREIEEEFQMSFDKPEHVVLENQEMLDLGDVEVAKDLETTKELEMADELETRDDLEELENIENREGEDE